MPTSARVTILYSDEDNGVKGRLGDRYESGQDGKKILLERCITSGFILKECGIQDIVLELDNMPAYRAGNASQRRALLLTEITRLFGTGSPVPIPEQAVISLQAQPEQQVQTVTKPVEPAQLTEPVTIEPAQQDLGRKVPNLGRGIE